jgi:hypothetical protein
MRDVGRRYEEEVFSAEGNGKDEETGVRRSERWIRDTRTCHA